MQPSIHTLVEQALQTGQLPPAAELEIHTLCRDTTTLSLQDYMALDRLKQALQSQTVQAMPRGQFINVMEQVLIEEALRQLAQISPAALGLLDLGEIVAYSLNRLPVLYATTQTGASHQRAHVAETLQAKVAETVTEAIANCQQPLPCREPVVSPALQNLVFG